MACFWIFIDDDDDDDNIPSSQKEIFHM